jgi:hypothetical protein
LASPRLKKKNEPSRRFSVKIETREDAIADLPTPGLPLIHMMLGAESTSGPASIGSH